MAVVTDFPVHGFDVSSYQPAAPDFRAGGRHFAIEKATEGTSYFDPHFTANRAAAHAQGMAAIGLYHFARSSRNSPEAEAAYFAAHVGPPQPGEFVILDYEEPGVGWKPDWIARFGFALQKYGWARRVLYTYAGMLGGFDRNAFPDLWVAAYARTAPGSVWTLWQHTDGQGSVSGNDGPWDCSVFRGSLDNLRTWIGTTPLPTNRTVLEEPMSYPPSIPADGKAHSVPVPPPHGGGCQGGYGNVWFSLSWDDLGTPLVATRRARIVGIKFDGTVYPLWEGRGVVDVPKTRASAVLQAGTASVSVTILDPGPDMVPMIEAETKGVPAA